MSDRNNIEWTELVEEKAEAFAKAQQGTDNSEVVRANEDLENARQDAKSHGISEKRVTVAIISGEDKLNS